MEFKLVPSIVKRAIGGGDRGSNSATSHAIAGTTAAVVGQYGSVFDPARQGWDVDEAARRGLERVIWVFRCVDAIAGNQARLPIITRDGHPENGKLVKNVPLFNLLNLRCNNYENAYQFRYRMSGQLLLSKRGVFVEVVTDGFGIPVQLHLLPPHQVEPIPDPDEFVKGYRLTLANGGWKDLPKEKVIWMRMKPHPIDPYAQMTPLMAAGLAAETDWLSRLFNANFLRNDGRPGMLIGVRGKTKPEDARELRDRFSGGPTQAGRTTVIEADDLNVVDFGVNPRDIQWLEGISGSKQDLMLAFGVPESVLGNASGRTFDNADAEIEVFWAETMKSHCTPIARDLDPLTGDINDNLFQSFDYDGVAVLQRHKEAQEAKYFERFQQGGMTLDEYLVATGKEPWDVPGSRVIYLQNGVVVARNPEDQAAVAAIPIIGAPAPGQQGEGGQPGALPPGPSPERLRQFAQSGALTGVAKGQRQFENIIAARASQLSLLNQGRALALTKSVRPAVERKSVELDNGHPYEDVRSRYEGMFEGVMETWSALQGDFFVDRLDTSTIRKGTKHWTGEGSGTKALDPNKVVNDARWVGDLKKSLSGMMQRIVAKTMNATASEMVQSGVIKVMNAQGLGSSQGRSKTARVYGTTQGVEKAVSDLLGPLNDVVETAAKHHLERIRQKIAEMDADGRSLTEIKREVSRMTSRNSAWRTQLAQYLTTALVEGAQHETWSKAGDLVTKTWNTTDDERVRHSHRSIDGKMIPVGKKFRVGQSMMRFPCAPEGSIEETAGCRCWTGYGISEKGSAAYDELAS